MPQLLADSTKTLLAGAQQKMRLGTTHPPKKNNTGGFLENSLGSFQFGFSPPIAPAKLWDCRAGPLGAFREAGTEVLQLLGQLRQLQLQVAGLGPPLLAAVETRGNIKTPEGKEDWLKAFTLYAIYMSACGPAPIPPSPLWNGGGWLDFA